MTSSLPMSKENSRKEGYDLEQFVADLLRAMGYRTTVSPQLKCAVDLYDQMLSWYANFLQTENGRDCIVKFDRTLPGYVWMSDVKKIDFYLWSIRD